MTHNHNTTSRAWGKWLTCHKLHGWGGRVVAHWTWPSRDSVQAPCMKSRQIYYRKHWHALSHSLHCVRQEGRLATHPPFRASKSGSRLPTFNLVCLGLVPGQIDSPYLIIMSWITIPRDEYHIIHSVCKIHLEIHKDLTLQRSQSAVHTIGTLRSDNGDVHENFLSLVAQLLKRREFVLELKRGVRARVQTEIIEFMALPFPSSKKT